MRLFFIRRAAEPHAQTNDGRQVFDGRRSRADRLFSVIRLIQGRLMCVSCLITCVVQQKLCKSGSCGVCCLCCSQSFFFSFCAVACRQPLSFYFSVVVVG